MFSTFDDDRRDVTARARAASVAAIIVPGIDLPSSQQARDLAAAHESYIYPSVGIHPYEAQHIASLVTTKKSLKSLIDDTVVGIGECGLDYKKYKGHAATGKKHNQKELLAIHIELATTHNLPLIMHCREAFDDLFTVLDESPETPHGVIHCFSGGLQDVRSALSRNLYIGIDGNVTYDRHIQHMVRDIPLQSLLLETDAPYLTPIPHRGERNESAHLPLVATKIAELKDISVEDVAEQTTRNAKKLFGISVV